MSGPRLSQADLVAIAAGGVGGAVLRRLITGAGTTGRTGGWFAYEPNTSATLMREELGIVTGTTFANLLGCLLLGSLTLLLVRSAAAHRRSLLALSVGFCGSLTTFSTFAVEAVQRFRGPQSDPHWLNVDAVREGGPALGLGYVAVSVIGGALAFAIGRGVTKQVTT